MTIPRSTPRSAPLGAILVGGESRRMGRDKATLAFRGRPLAEHVASLVAGVVPEVVLVAREAKDPRFSGFSVIGDRFAGAGPLAGLHAALIHARGRRVLLVACDLPGLTTRLLRHIALPTPRSAPAASRPPSDTEPWARVPEADGRLQPLAALYSPGCLEIAEEHLRSGRRAMHRFLEALTLTVVPLTPELPFYREGMLTNINLPEDYRRLAAAASGGGENSSDPREEEITRAEIARARRES